MDILTDYRSVIRQIDRHAADGTPFLFALDFEKSKGLFITHPSEQQDILYEVNGKRNYHPLSPISLSHLDLRPEVEPFETFKRRFDIVQRGLLHGDSFLTNLTITTPIRLQQNLQDVFRACHAPYKLCVPGHFVCFSPERFITIDTQGQISTFPMKGTIDANIPQAEEVILSDYKETAEHCTIVDLMRNDLNAVAHQVRVKRFRYIDRIKTAHREILQVSSEITGHLPQDYTQRLGQIIDSLLPAGSISGAPKEATVRLIRQAEERDRGFYTGIFGYYDGTSLESAVLIRFISINPDGTHLYHSGGGNTINSDPKDEYEEIKQKIYIPI